MSPLAAARVSLTSEYATILRKLTEFLRNRSVPAFLVGGYIRDSLRAQPTRDVDIAVQAEPLPLAKVIAAVFSGSCAPIDQRGRVARVVIPARDQSKWVIDLCGIEGSIDDDLQRRDFSVDAMALSLDDWGTPSWEELIHDPFGGREDLSKGIIRAISATVFQEDPARLLRAFRLAATLGFGIDPRTAQLIARDAHLISSVAGERVRDEFLTILSLDMSKVHLEKLDELGLLCCIIPELAMTKGVSQPREHYWDVFGHSVSTVEGVEQVGSGRESDPVSSLVPWDHEMHERFAQEVSDGHTRRTLLKLAALLHDIGKPQTKIVDAMGKTRFLGHQTLGASMAADVLGRLRLSKRGTEMVCLMVENHLRPTHMSQGDELPTARAVYRYFKDVGDVAIDTLYLSLADHLAARGPDLDMDGWERHVSMMAHVLEVGTREQAPERLRRLITGHDLIQEFGLTPGPIIGTLLEGAQEAQAAGEVDSQEAALAWVRRRLARLDPEGAYARASGA